MFGKQSEYQLKFNNEDDGLWYVDFPNWPFDHHNLLMVAGADKLCDFLSDDGKTTHVDVIPCSKRKDLPGYAANWYKVRIPLQVVHSTPSTVCQASGAKSGSAQ
ncbi:MAG: hypothetical protein IJR20_05325 [Muribaculaceae bacterium]|nr:hypothetical protein [Muribaculaceae bacterium]